MKKLYYHSTIDTLPSYPLDNQRIAPPGRPKTQHFEHITVD